MKDESGAGVAERDYLTPADVAEKLGVHENTVRQWCEKGLIGTRVGSRWRIVEEELVKVAPGYGKPAEVA